MQKSQEVIGLSVFHRKSGQKVGVVKDILFDASQCFMGLLLEDGGWFQRRRYIPNDNIVSIGRDAVIIEDRKRILPFDESTKDWTGVCSGQKSLKGQPVLLTSGHELGIIENVYFMEEMGTIVGYELSDGWLHDVVEGRKVLKTSEPLIWGRDACIAREDHVQVQSRN